MKVSYKWLSEFVNIDIPYTKLGDKFSLMSQEVADVYKLTDVSNIVVGYVKSKEKHPDADKLNVCIVDVGEELQIVCGAPNIEEGQKVIVALVGAELPGDFKIKKSKIRGIESFGMICSLNELGIDKKFVDVSGIHVLQNDAEIGANPLKLLELDDEVMELDLTPNRGDLLSVMGVAYDTAAILDKELLLKEPFIQEIDDENDIKVKIETENCMSYYARVIKGVNITESPDWLKARLIAAGIRPINNIVDITNYIMLETGQPLHAFDLDKFESNEVVVRMANSGEVIKTLDNEDRELTEADIVITNGKVPTALGGVMGGLNTEIDENTKYVLLESATFNPLNVRRTSRRLDLRSDSSTRFEKGVDPNRTVLALNRACEMFQNIAGGKVLSNISKVENNDLNEKVIDIELNYIKNVIGYDYKLEDIEDVFDRLGFEYKQKKGIFKVQLPTRRLDLLTKQDLVEEVVRIHGYDKVALTLPKTVSKGKLSNNQLRTRKIRRILQGLGLDEVLTYSLVNENNIYDFTLEQNEYTKLLMPMSEDKAVMRHTPLNGLISTLKYNIARKMSDLSLFEISKKYTKEEELLVGGALTGIQNKTPWKGNYEKVDFYYTKGIVESLLESLGVIATFEKPESTNKNYHPGQTAYIYQNNNLIGFISKLHPKYQSENDLNDTFIFELNLDMIQFEDDVTKFVQLQKYPVINRDIAIVVDRTIPVNDVITVIRNNGKKLLKDIEIFDVYTGENVSENEKSIALKLLFMDPTRTLETEEVTNRVNKIIKGLEVELNAKLRD
ncbi:phenylalanine--tRNA ligase subunit beta [Mycoplasmatota bacterium WC44]